VLNQGVPVKVFADS